VPEAPLEAQEAERSNLPKIEVRPIGAHEGDAVHAVLEKAATSAALELGPSTRVHDLLGRFGERLGTDSLAVFSDGVLAAIGLLFLPPFSRDEDVASLLIEVDPTRRDKSVRDALVQWIDARTQQVKDPQGRPHRLRSGCDLCNESRLELLSDVGFSPARYAFKMRVELPNRAADYPLPQTLRLIPWDPERDDEALSVFSKAFAEHWGLPTQDAQMWEQRFVGVPQFRADLSVLALQGDTPVGLCVNWVRVDAPTIGWIEAIGVIPSHRGQGVADAMMSRSLEAFRKDGLSAAELDVDTENPTGALQLYEKHGFRRVSQTVVLEKTLH